MTKTSLQNYTGKSLRYIWGKAKKYWQAHWYHKAVIVLVLFITLSVFTMYGIARWYAYTERNKPYVQGVSFIADYAQSLGVDPHQTMTALIDQVGVRNFRLVSYWNDIEPEQGKYNFDELDWEFKQVEAVHGHVTLSVGLRQPRWPECHVPSWVDASKPTDQWQAQLEQFMTTVITRYKNSPALDSYQVENEYFLSAFGTCQNFDRQRLVDEFNLVKQHDPHHTVIISRSNNALGTPINAPTPDEFGVSVYKRVWDTSITHRYVEYPFPPWFYGFLAGVQKMTTGKDMIIHELQAEPWPPNKQQIVDTPLVEQSKSLDAARLQTRFKYAHDSGIHEVYYWGAEYWYYRKVVLHDNSLWQVATNQFQGA